MRIEREQATEQQSCCRRTNGEINDQQPEQRYAENRHGSRQATKSSEGTGFPASAREYSETSTRGGARHRVFAAGPEAAREYVVQDGTERQSGGAAPWSPSRSPPNILRRRLRAQTGRLRAPFCFQTRRSSSGRPNAYRISQSPRPECSSSNRDRPVFGQSPTASPSNFKDSAFASGCLWSRHLVLYEPDNGGQDRAGDPAPSNLADKRTDIYLIGG